MIGRLIVADQKLVMLNPLLFDKDLVGKWDGSYGAHGLNLLSMTLYFDLIRELTAISLDNDRRTPSIKNILRMLDAQDLLTHLKHEYCKPRTLHWSKDLDENSKNRLEEKHRKLDLAENEEGFNEIFYSVKDGFKLLEASDLSERIHTSRDKIIAHYEMRRDVEAPRLYGPSDFGLKWGDVEEYFESIKPIVTNLVLMLANEVYPLDEYRIQHAEVAYDFWHK